MDVMQASAKPIEPIDLAPLYNTARLELALRDAADGFKGPWRGLLGLEFYEGVVKEHWARVKALCRRIANRMDNDEYAHLKPKSDMVDKLQSEIARWLENPSGWTRADADEVERRNAIEEVKRNVHQGIQKFVEMRLIDSHTTDWNRAFIFRGTGSSFEQSKGYGTHI